jgi:hypothetical protein
MQYAPATSSRPPWRRRTNPLSADEGGVPEPPGGPGPTYNDPLYRDLDLDPVYMEQALDDNLLSLREDVEERESHSYFSASDNEDWEALAGAAPDMPRKHLGGVLGSVPAGFVPGDQRLMPTSAELLRLSDEDMAEMERVSNEFLETM